MKKTCLFIALLSAFLGFSQFNPSAPWMNRDAENRNDNEKTLAELVNSFNTFWSFHDKNRKGSGHKPFMRWVEHWKNATNDQGYVISPQELWAAWEQKNQAKSNNKNLYRSLPPCNWQPIGPIQNASPQSTQGRGRINVVCVDPSNPNTIYFGAPAGGIWKSINAGDSWTPLADYLPQIGVSGIAVDPNNSNIIYISTGDKDASDSPSVGVLKSINGGVTWSTTGLTFNNSYKGAGDLLINPTNSEMLWCATSTGLYRTINGGSSWTNQLSGNFTQGTLRIKPNDPTVVYVSSRNKFYKSTDSGSTFSTTVITGLPTNSGRLIFDVTAADPNIVYCLSAGTSPSYAFQGIFKSINGGITFVNTGLTSDVLENTQAWYDLAFCVSQTNANELYTGCLNVWKSSDGGATATKLNSWSSYSGNFTHADIHFLKFMNNKLYCGSDGGIYISEDGGLVFNDIIGQAQISQFYKISVSKQTASKITGGLQDNGGFAFSNTVWRSYHGGDGMDNAIDPSNSNKAYGFVQYGLAFYGITSLSSPVARYTAPPRVNGVALEGEWVSPLRVNSVGEVFAGYNDLYKLTNNAWILRNTSSIGDGAVNLNLISIDPSNNDIMYVSKTNQMFVSTDRGISFSLLYTASSRITSITVHSSNSTIIYITTAGTSGDAFISTDGGSSFAAIASGLPAIGKNIIVHQGQNSLNPLYVATTLGVFYKDDSMANWATFDDNLPNVSVTDLEINLVDNKIIAGTFGRGAWQCNIPVQESLSNQEFEMENIAIYPNPSKGIFNVSVGTITPKTILVYDIIGKIVCFKDEFQNNQSTVLLDLSNVSNGVYFVKIISENKSVTRRIIKN